MTFIALEKPVYYKYNSTYGTHYWEVRGDTTAPGYWRLYTNCILYDGNANNSPTGVGNLFDSECDAHGAAAAYYHQHGVSYPYIADWNDALHREEYGIDDTVENGEGTVESEVMVFV